MSRARARCDQGHTLVEILVVAGLLVVVLGSVITYFVSSRRHAAALQDRVEGLEHVHRGLRRLSRELRGARRLLSPLPGARLASELIFVDGDGRVVRYSWSASPPRMGGSWTRQEWNQRKEELHPDLALFECRIAPVPPGRDPGLVHLRVGIPGPDGKPIRLFASVRSRALEARCLVER